MEGIKTEIELIVIANDFQRVLDVQFHKDDIAACLLRMSELENIMTQSGKYLADAKYLQDKEQVKIKQAIEELGTKLSPSTLNNYIKSKTHDINYVVNWMERITRSSTHLCENLRTAISYLKTEMNLLNYKP
jgi:hypothetical protein